jgi:F-box-like
MSLLLSEILHHVFSFFDSVDLERCGSVNRLWNKVGNSPELWRAMAVRKYGESVSDTTIHMYSNKWKDLLHDDNRKGAFRVLNVNKPCNSLDNGGNRHNCCMVVSLIWDRRSWSTEGGGRLYVAIDARGEWDLRPPIDSSLKKFDHSSAAYSYSTKWISTIEERHFEGHYKGLLLYPIFSDHDLHTKFFGDLYFSYANRYHSGDFDSIKISEGNWNSITWDSYITYKQMITAHESEEIDRRRWEGVLPLERQPLPPDIAIIRSSNNLNTRP